MSNYPDYMLKVLDDTLTQFPDVPTRTLAKRIYKQHSKFFRDVEQVRSALRRRRGNNGSTNVKATKHNRPNQKAGWTPELPPSLAEEWLPHEIKGPERIAIISDVHLPYHNVETLNTWYAEAQEYEPSTIILNGDTLDFYRMSRFEKDPNKRNTRYELDTAHEFLDWLQAGFEAKIIWKDGNHDERWRKYLWNFAPEFAALDETQLHNILDLEDRGIEYVTDKRIIMGGDLPILHGHEMQGSGGSISPARSMASKLRSSGLQGHVHRTSEYLERNVFGDYMKCYSMGCMCELTPEYARINRWNHGYAFLDVNEDNSYNLNNVVVS